MPLICALRATCLLCLLALPGISSDNPQQSDPVRMGPGVTPPKLIEKVQPTYQEGASRAGVQGTVVFEAVVNEAGKIEDLTVMSPLGFGLDEKAREAIEKWRFEPGRKAGEEASVLVTIEVNFRLVGKLFDRKAEKRRTDFNLALREVQEQSGERREQAIETIQRLAKRKYPPAMYLLGKLLEVGDTLAPDPERARLLLQKAADKDYGPALFDLGMDYCEGKGMPIDLDKGLRMIRNAAVRGSRRAQFDVGVRYETGMDGPAKPDRARAYFRLCAAKGAMACQVRLAKLLLDRPNRRERDHLQAIAWLRLAADQGHSEARYLAERETPQLTSEQIDWVERLMTQMVHKE